MVYKVQGGALSSYHDWPPKVPALFGAVSFFHSVEGVPDMKLTSCLIARIFTRDITDWSHPDILEYNPDIDLSALEELTVTAESPVVDMSSESSLTAS